MCLLHTKENEIVKMLNNMQVKLLAVLIGIRAADFLVKVLGMDVSK